MPEVKQLENQALENAERWKTYEETEEFRQVYVRKSKEQRQENLQREESRQQNLEDDDDQCTTDPP